MQVIGEQVRVLRAEFLDKSNMPFVVEVAISVRLECGDGSSDLLAHGVDGEADLVGLGFAPGGVDG